MCFKGHALGPAGGGVEERRLVGGGHGPGRSEAESGGKRGGREMLSAVAALGGGEADEGGASGALEAAREGGRESDGVGLRGDAVRGENEVETGILGTLGLGKVEFRDDDFAGVRMEGGVEAQVLKNDLVVVRQPEAADRRVDGRVDETREAGARAEPGWEKGASMSLQLLILAMRRVKESVHSSRTRRAMISRPEMSRNE